MILSNCYKWANQCEVMKGIHIFTAYHLTLFVALGKYCSNQSAPLNCTMNCGKGVGGRGGEGVGGGGGVGVLSLGGGVLGLETNFSTFILVPTFGAAFAGSSLGASGGGVGGGVGVGSLSSSMTLPDDGRSISMPSFFASFDSEGAENSSSSTDFSFSSSFHFFLRIR